MSVKKRTTPKGLVRYDVRVRDADGRVTTRTFRTRAEADSYEREYLRARDRGELADTKAARITFGEVAEEWLNSNPAKRAKTLLNDRRSLALHVLPTFGARRLSAIRPADVQDLVNTWKSSGVKAYTVRGRYSSLRAVFNLAVHRDYIGRSPCRGINLPRLDADNRRALEPAEVLALAANLPERYRPMVLVAAETGLRYSEVAALRVGRINFMGEPFLDVLEGVTEAGGGLHFNPPKSAAGARRIVLSEQLRDVLAEHLLRLELSGADHDELVFQGEHGGAVRYSNFRARYWVPAREAVGVPWAGFHDLRRFMASTLVLANIDPKTLATRAGHSDVRLTLQVYAKASTKADRGAAEAMSSALFPDLPREIRAMVANRGT